MSSYDVVLALTWRYGVRLKLNKERTRVGLSREDAKKVPDEVKRAVRENHDELLRGELFHDAHRRFLLYMTEKHGADEDGPACGAGWKELGADLTHERLNDAWCEEDLDGFKRALKEYLRAGARAFPAALRGQPPEGSTPLPQGPRSSAGPLRPRDPYGTPLARRVPSPTTAAGGFAPTRPDRCYPE
jgi:hypothetical protein